ncbi:hypothetical protein J2W30_003613 [Variovorax boronicumulans]|uniref:hypothetical protein n=1 Tax=Variovorax boronicumulans TaxID=436515 RepID=UPI00278B20FE|nr:hypothetical protein [Variovorax boronicumulans]MDQ0035845.1 hypothetical protein [Variovorax boronicumulans]
MAKIPTGNFGQRLPQGSDVRPMEQVDNQVTDAAARLGQTAMNIGASMFAEQKQKDEENARRAEQVQTMTAHANIQNGLADSFDAVQADLLEGKTDKIAAEAAWKDASQKVVADNLKGVPADRAPLVAAQVKGLEGQLQNKLLDTFRKRDQQDVAAGLVTYREQQERFAATDPGAAVKQYSTFVDQMAPGAGWSPEQAAKAKQSFVENVSFNTFRREAQGYMQSGDTAGLEKLQTRINGPDGDALDPAKRDRLDQTIYGWKQSIEAKQARLEDKAEREQTKRFNVATDTVNKGRDLVLNGAAMAPEFIADMVEKAQGTGLEPQVRDLLEAQKSVAGFANQTAPQRAALLERARAMRADPARGATPESEKQLKAAEQIDDRLRRKIDDGEAWSAAQSVGVINQAPLMNIGDAKQAMAVFQQRAQDIGTVETWAGRKVSPLQPQEAEQFQKLVRTLKPDQAATMLGQIGAVVGDSDRIAAVAKQIGDKDGRLGMAMLYANAQTTQGRYTAQLVLEGDQAIRDKTVKVDGAVETGWRADIAKKVRGAYSNQEVENHIVDAAFLIAAAKGGDVDNAINLAAGGIIERNGGKIPLPYGMKEREFEKRIEAMTPADLAAQAPGGFVQAGPARVPLADFVKTLPDARLVHAGQGLYNVRAGNTLVTNERGQRITLKVSP